MSLVVFDSGVSNVMVGVSLRRVRCFILTSLDQIAIAKHFLWLVKTVDFGACLDLCGNEALTHASGFGAWQQTQKAYGLSAVMQSKLL